MSAGSRHCSQGSEWRIWDLHFHTPASFDYDDKSVTNGELVERLVSAGTRVVAITDHHVIDIDRIKEIQELAGDRLTVLPGIEVRTELGGSNSVHLVGLFSEDCDPQRIWEILRVKFKIPELITQLGEDAVFVKFEEFAKTVHENGGLVSVHAGSKANGIEEISNHTQYKQALKTGLAKRAVDIYEVGRRADLASYAEKVFPKIGKVLPAVLGTDSHGVKSYMPPTTWIKADPCFLGLRQVIHDPVNRVSLDDVPPALRRVQQNKNQYMKSVSFAKKADSTLGERWFEDVFVPLNPGLVTVIGNKGSGKSALAESLGLLGNCPHTSSYSFLNKSKFLSGRRPKAAAFDATVEWGDGQVVTRNLAEAAGGAPATVRHLPQNYLESICNEIQTDEESAFRNELEAIVFSHVDPTTSHGRGTLREVVAYRKSQIDAALVKRREAMTAVNVRIADAEKKLLPSFRLDIEAKLERVRQEVKVLEAARPADVSPATAGSAEAELTERLDSLRQKLAEIDGTLRQKCSEAQGHTETKVSAGKLVQAVRNLEREHEDFKATWEREKGTVSICVDDIVSMKVTTKSLDELIAGAQSALDAIQVTRTQKSKVHSPPGERRLHSRCRGYRSSCLCQRGSTKNTWRQ